MGKLLFYCPLIRSYQEEFMRGKDFEENFVEKEIKPFPKENKLMINKLYNMFIKYLISIDENRYKSRINKISFGRKIKPHLEKLGYKHDPHHSLYRLRNKS